MDDARLLLEELAGFADEDVIVEGVKDERALKSLGFSRVHRLNGGGSLLDAVESLQDRGRVVVLTDLDREGKILRRKLLSLFGPYGIHEIVRPREILARMKLSHVEGLTSLIRGQDFL